MNGGSQTEHKGEYDVKATKYYTVNYNKKHSVRSTHVLHPQKPSYAVKNGYYLLYRHKRCSVPIVRLKGDCHFFCTLASLQMQLCIYRSLPFKARNSGRWLWKHLFWFITAHSTVITASVIERSIKSVVILALTLLWLLLLSGNKQLQRRVMPSLLCHWWNILFLPLRWLCLKW